MRRARGLFNLMPYLAERGVIHLLTAEHIDGKVYARLPQACKNTRVNLAAATAAYETVHRPLLRLVDVGDLMLHDARVEIVHLADEEDGRLAQLSVLLAPSLVLTRDRHLLNAGLGERNWADALVGLKGLIELDERVWGTTEGMVLTARLAGLGLREVGRLMRRSDWALGFGLGFALAAGLEFGEQLQSVPRRLNETGAPVVQRMLSGITGLHERLTDAQEQVSRTLVVLM